MTNAPWKVRTENHTGMRASCSCSQEVFVANTHTSCFGRLNSSFVLGSHGASKHVQIVAYPTVEQAVAFLRQKCGCSSIVGLLGCLPTDGHATDSGVPVSVVQKVGTNSDGNFLVRATTGGVSTGNCEAKKHCVDNHRLACHRSLPVSACPFKMGNICFAISKERQGLSLVLAQKCDTFVHVPHAAAETTSMDLDAKGKSTATLLDVQCCVSITLHHFTNWASYDEKRFQGHKFKVDHQVHVPGSRNSEQRREQRAKEKATRVAEDEEDMTAVNLCLFDDGDGDGHGDGDGC